MFVRKFRTVFTIVLVIALSTLVLGCRNVLRKDSAEAESESSNTWAWMLGSSTRNQAGDFDSKGSASAANMPSARYGGAAWTDSSGYLWMFGGYGYDSSDDAGYLNDVWKFDGSQWTWVSGAGTCNQEGVYGTEGKTASSNLPGGRWNPMRFVDGSGNLWLFGGAGYDVNGSLGVLNDLWKFNGKNWTWVSGSSTRNQTGTYGTQGTASSDTVPGSRNRGVMWKDSDGNLWLFGGYGYDGSGSLGNLNDLWEYSGSKWTWAGGSSTRNQAGTYGTQGAADSDNVPGSRVGSISWTDGSGNLWLFGGYGYDSDGTLGHLNDLWKFDGSTWTWVSGNDTCNQTGNYGTKGTAASSNMPGGRMDGTGWVDGNGTLWLFGGYGYDSYGDLECLNDEWIFDGSKWTWISGSDTCDEVGTYGTKGIAASGTIPGSRYGAMSWLDSSGDLWLFGGYGYDDSGDSGYLNDMWRYIM